MKYSVREPTKEEFNKMFDLRWRILRKPLGLPHGTERDPKEEQGIHVIALENDTIIGSGRITFDKETARIDYVVVDKAHRHKRIGRKIMNFLQNKAKERKTTHIILDSRKASEKFYKKLGYVTVGDYFVKRKGDKHIRMELQLKDFNLET